MSDQQQTGCKVLEVQKFFRSGNTLEDLLKQYAIKYTFSEKNPTLVLLKYDMVESPFVEKIVRECRGIILDTRNWDIVCHPFHKFFNYGETYASMIDWRTARVQEKLDGSLANLYFFDGMWNISTSGMPDASSNVGDFNVKFNQLFWDTFKELGYTTEKLDRTCTYMFELMTPLNRVVVPHKTNGLTLIGARVTMTGEEIVVSELAYLGFKIVKEFPLKTIDDIVSTFDALNPLDQEGYVVLDKGFNRVKVKHPGYVRIHHIRDSVSMRSIMEIIQSGETPEFLTYYPEYTEIFDDASGRLSSLIDELQVVYDKVKDISVQKDFAIAIKELELSAPLFSLRSGKVRSFREFFKNYNTRNLIKLLGLRDEEVSNTDE